MFSRLPWNVEPVEAGRAVRSFLHEELTLLPAIAQPLAVLFADLNRTAQGRPAAAES